MTSQGVKVNFESGSLLARGKNAEDDNGLMVESGGTSIDIGNSEAALSKSGNDQISLDVSSGNAKVKNNNKNFSVGKNQTLTVAGKDVVVKENPIVFISPARNQIFISSKPFAEVKFQWKTNESGGEGIQISQKSNFSKITHQSKTANSTHTAKLNSGDYYWRVKSLKGALSNVRKFSVINEKPSVVIAPRNSEVFRFIKKEPLITFSWQGSRIANSYSIEIASDKSMKKIIKKIQSFQTRISVDSLAEGVYFWRVVNNYNFGEIENPVATEPSQFSITKGKNVEPVALISPANGEKITTEQVKNGKILFSWRPGEEFTEYRISISKDPSFKTAVLTSATKNSYFEITEALPSGEYFWKVDGKTVDEKFSEPSRKNRLIVEIIKPVINFSPLNNAVLKETNKDGDIAFSWIDSARWGYYRLDISHDAGFSKISDSVFSANNSISVKNLKQGKIFWRVHLIDQNKKSINSSAVSNFYLPRMIAAPEVIRPVNNINIDMTNLDRLTFEWNKVPGANRYRLKMYAYNDPLKKPVFESEVAATNFQFKDLSKLDRTDYCIEMQALEIEGKNILGQSVIKKYFFSIKLNEKIEIPLIITPREVYVE
jgi:hypothetical protein